jgi:prepilin-type processing-associated H-X9-DG protein/prepilin-type N-terminal cleavage/methylation domain-containing protein
MSAVGAFLTGMLTSGLRRISLNAGKEREREKGMKQGREYLGFSLLEVMVTTAVLLILAAFLLPALSRARHQSRSIQCVGNLRQWGVALHLYAVCNDDFLPREGKPTPLESDLRNPGYQAWYIDLPAQIKVPRYSEMPWRTNPAAAPNRSVWICPCNPRRCNASSKTNNLFHYCLNDGIDGTGDKDRPVQISVIPGASGVVYLFDSKNLPAVGGPTFVHTNLHSRGAQFLFLDGHVARFSVAAYWDFSKRRAVVNNPELVWSP